VLECLRGPSAKLGGVGGQYRASLGKAAATGRILGPQLGVRLLRSRKWTWLMFTATGIGPEIDRHLPAIHEDCQIQNAVWRVATGRIKSENSACWHIRNLRTVRFKI
jgi:hypothetical protein